MKTPRQRHNTAFAVAVVILAACGGTNLIGPANELEVGNLTDQFQFQVSDLDNVTDRRTYTWENTGTQATIDVSQAITAGSAPLVIRDAAGTIMYQDDVGDDNDTTTSAGVPGSWTIELDLIEVSGTFNFRVQKTT